MKFPNTPLSSREKKRALNRSLEKMAKREAKKAARKDAEGLISRIRVEFHTVYPDKPNFIDPKKPPLVTWSTQPFETIEFDVPPYKPTEKARGSGFPNVATTIDGKNWVISDE